MDRDATETIQSDSSSRDGAEKPETTFCHKLSHRGFAPNMRLWQVIILIILMVACGKSEPPIEPPTELLIETQIEKPLIYMSWNPHPEEVIYRVYGRSMIAETEQTSIIFSSDEKCFYLTAFNRDGESPRTDGACLQ